MLLYSGITLQLLENKSNEFMPVTTQQKTQLLLFQAVILATCFKLSVSFLGYFLCILEQVARKLVVNISFFVGKLNYKIIIKHI